MLSLLRFAFPLSDFSLTRFCDKMYHGVIYRELLKLVEDGDANGLREKGKEIGEYIDYEMRNETGDYLVYQIGAHRDHGKGRILFQIFKNVCHQMSPYRWTEIMALMGRSFMAGAVESQNIKLLEHAMSHVDEIYLERLLYDVDAPEVQEWYDENFVVT
jgi:hypothetical protein